MKRKLIILGIGLAVGAGIGAALLARADHGNFHIILTNGDTGVRWWIADYLADTQYADRTGWVAGDRAGYRCAYMFLETRGRIVGRVTFTRVEGASYARVNDDGMEEGTRHWIDGSLNTSENPVLQSDCPPPDQNYEPYFGPDERPTITYNGGRRGVLEVRTYAGLVMPTGTKFRLAEATPNRATVIFYNDNQPALVVYYDSLSPRVAMEAGL